MTIASNDISYVYSGGFSNNNAAASIGGEPSTTLIQGVVNNLFDDIGKERSLTGSIDYRCFYVINTSVVDSLFNAEFYINSQVSGGSTIAIGVEQATDVQRLVISGNVTGGSMDLSYDGDTFTVSFHPTLASWGQNLQNAMNSLSSLSGVIVSTSQIGTTKFFEIRFEGNDDLRNHDLVVIEDLSGLNGTGISGNIGKLQEGAPINAVAQEIGNDETIPFGVTFSAHPSSNPILLGEFKPMDAVAIWVQRTTPAGVDAVASDGVQFRLSGTPIDV